MAFKFSKATIKERDEVVEAAKRKLDTLNAEIAHYNEDLADMWAKVEEAEADYNGALADARDFIERARDEFDTEYDEKSEKWQEGDKGTAARDWLDSFDSVELEDSELPEPEMLSEESGEGLDALENLDTEAAS